MKSKSGKAKALKPKALKKSSPKTTAVEVHPVKSKATKVKLAKATIIKSKASIIKPRNARPVSTKDVWPVKTHELHNNHMNSTAWNNFKFRDDDIVIATYAKSGTTWTQQIVAQLIFAGAEGLNIHQMSPWVDLRILPPPALAALEGQTHKRLSSHSRAVAA